jgi:hypothetical protein
MSLLELEYKKLQTKLYINPELALAAKDRGNVAFREANYQLAITEYEEALRGEGKEIAKNWYYVIVDGEKKFYNYVTNKLTDEDPNKNLSKSRGVLGKIWHGITGFKEGASIKYKDKRGNLKYGKITKDNDDGTYNVLDNDGTIINNVIKDNLQFDSPVSLESGGGNINGDEYEYQYYLPVIYPPTEEIMYGFCDFLNKQGYKYIWANNKFDAKRLSAQIGYGTQLTFPIKEYKNTDVDDKSEPICIVLSPNHKEGFSFTFNPAIFVLGLCDTSGDEEQVYGRVLRKYRIGGYEGKYDKKIYQYFGGDVLDQSLLQWNAVLYTVGKNVTFRGCYDNIGYANTSSYATNILHSIPVLGPIVANAMYCVRRNAVTAWNYSSFFSKETFQYYWRGERKKDYGEGSKERENIERGRLTEKETVQLEEALKKEFPRAPCLFDEVQLKLLYGVKKINLDFFNNIVAREIITKEQDRTDITPIFDVNSYQPLDLVSINKSKESNKEFCIENLEDKTGDIFTATGRADGKLKLNNCLICLSKGYDDGCIKTTPSGGSIHTKTMKKYHRKINKKTKNNYKFHKVSAKKYIKNKRNKTMK